MVASLSEEVREQFHHFGELISELLKLAALLIFGAALSLKFLVQIGWRGYLFAVLAIVLVRPVAILLAMVGSRMSRREKLVAAWFGPKGFASVVFGLLLLKSTLPTREHLFHLVAVVVLASIIAHSSTDVIVARWFKESDKTAPTPDSPNPLQA